ncbi:MAG TPA: HEPN domain-containing protein [Ferruginibacter sp.]|nr:HEPN domain-containing protein [Ferruginibacter sp.]
MVKEKTYLKEFTQKEIDRSINFQYATHVNHAYAFELYLKCIMIIENGEYFEGHELLELFKLLSEKAKKNIETRYTSNFSVFRRNRTYLGFFESPSVYDLLEEANKAFTDFRYLFSRKNTPTYELDDLIECVREEIFQLKFELKDSW